MPHDKISKILFRFSSWKTLKGSEVRSHYSNIIVLGEHFEQQTDCSRYRRKIIDSRKKNLLSWQNILNSRQTAADIEEKLANQGKVLRKEISHIYLSVSNKWKPCHGVVNSWPRNLRMAPEKYFLFQRNCKQTTGWSEEQDSKLWDKFLARLPQRL